MMRGRRRRAGLGEAVALESFSCACTREGGASAARELLRGARDVAAILVADEIVVGALQELRAAGLRVPQDVSLFGFDDVEPLNLFDPPIIAVRQPIEEMDWRAVEMPVAPPDGPARPGETLLPVEMIRCASCASPAQTHQQRGMT